MSASPPTGFLGLVLAASLGHPGCSSTTQPEGDPLAFPAGFQFGSAVAGFQVDMGCPTIPPERCVDPNSDWYQFVTSTITLGRSQNHLSGDPPEKGPGFFELFDADLDRARDLSLTSFRFSIEWSRIFPVSTVGVEGHEALLAIASPDALDYYRRLLGALKARGIRPVVTLHHYTLPRWLHDAVGCNSNLARCRPRGWLEDHAVAEIAKYAGFVARELGAEVDTWATLNEPLAVLLSGYLLPGEARTNPPAQTLAVQEARTVLDNMIFAHARMVDAVRANDTSDADGDGRATSVGLVYPLAPIQPFDPDNALDQRAARNLFYVYNEAFLNAAILGVYDGDLNGEGAERADLVGRSDYLGLNYYFAVKVQGSETSVLPALSPLLTFNPLAVEQGAAYPLGLAEVLRFVTQKYPKTPIIITENGATADDPLGQERYLVEHLAHLLTSIHEDGADVRGYHWWSLMDNYEWNHGLALRFGLYEVNNGVQDKTRTRRAFADTYQTIASEGRLNETLADRYPIRR